MKNLTESRSELFKKIKFLLQPSYSKENISTLINPFFYKIQKENKSFYILGSSHDLPYSVLPHEIQKIIKSLRTLMVEPIEERWLPCHLPKSVYELGREANPKNSPLRTLEANLGEELFSKFGEFLYQIQPWVLIYLITEGHLNEDFPPFDIEEACTVTANIKDIIETVALPKDEQNLIIDDGARTVVKKNKGKVIGLETQADVVISQELNKLTFNDLLSFISTTDDPRKEDTEIEALNKFTSASAGVLENIYKVGDVAAVQDTNEADCVVHQLQNVSLGASLPESRARRSKN